MARYSDGKGKSAGIAADPPRFRRSEPPRGSVSPSRKTLQWCVLSPVDDTCSLVGLCESTRRISEARPTGGGRVAGSGSSKATWIDGLNADNVDTGVNIENPYAGKGTEMFELLKDHDQLDRSTTEEAYADWFTSNPVCRTGGTG
jgi:hypothetical protein